MTDLQLINFAIQRLKVLGFGSQKAIGKLLGYSNESSFSQVLNGKVNIPNDLIDRIANLNEDIKNFITESRKIKTFNENPKTNAKIVSNDPQTIELPLITVSARASFDYEVFNDNHNTIYETADVYKIRIKGLKKPILIDIDGDSMGPQLKANTRVLADEVDCSDWQYITGVVAVFFKKQFVIKRIRENNSIETNTITLYSDNEIGGVFTVAMKDITAIWKIIEIVKAKVE